LPNAALPDPPLTLCRKSYFSQFGTVTRLRLSRNKKTGRSKHFGFVEFADKEVAEIVSQTMDSYLLYGHILRARMVPADQVHPNLWKGANRRFKAVPWNRMAGRHLEKPAGETTWNTRIDKEQRRRSERAEKLKELMDYEFESTPLKPAKVGAPKAVEDAAEKAPEAIEPPVVSDEQAEAEKVAQEPKAVVETVKKAKSGKKGAKGKKVKS
jgi:nucleolar protein 15